MKWAIEIQRTTLEPRNLRDLLASLGFTLVDSDRFPAFTSPEINQCANASEAFDIAKRVRSAFTGPAQLDQDFSLGSVIDFTSFPTTRHAFVEVHSCVMAMTLGSVTLTLSPPAGLSTDEIEAWNREREEREYEAKLNAQKSKLVPVYREPRAAKVLEYLRTTNLTAEILYKVYELVEGHPSNRTAFQERFSISPEDFKRFGDAVHNPTVSGDWARHAYHDTPKTSNPMSRNEAESFVRNLVEKWLATI